jgi:hypothetical protein
MAKAKKKAAKKRADHYEPKVRTDLSFDELISMSVDKLEKPTGHRIKNPEASIGGTIKPQEEKTDKKK